MGIRYLVLGRLLKGAVCTDLGVQVAVSEQDLSLQVLVDFRVKILYIVNVFVTGEIEKSWCSG